MEYGGNPSSHTRTNTPPPHTHIHTPSLVRTIVAIRCVREALTRLRENSSCCASALVSTLAASSESWKCSGRSSANVYALTSLVAASAEPLIFSSSDVLSCVRGERANVRNDQSHSDVAISHHSPHALCQVLQGSHAPCLGGVISLKCLVLQLKVKAVVLHLLGHKAVAAVEGSNLNITGVTNNATGST